MPAPPFWGDSLSRIFRCVFLVPSLDSRAGGKRGMAGRTNSHEYKSGGLYKWPSILERVTDIVAEQLGVDKEKISSDTSFVNDLGADSLDTVELVMELEEEFDINIPDDAAEKIQTVGQAVSFIEENGDG